MQANRLLSLESYAAWCHQQARFKEPVPFTEVAYCSRSVLGTRFPEYHAIFDSALNYRVSVLGTERDRYCWVEHIPLAERESVQWYCEMMGVKWSPIPILALVHLSEYRYVGWMVVAAMTGLRVPPDVLHWAHLEWLDYDTPDEADDKDSSTYTHLSAILTARPPAQRTIYD